MLLFAVFFVFTLLRVWKAYWICWLTSLISFLFLLSISFEKFLAILSILHPPYILSFLFLDIKLYDVRPFHSVSHASFFCIFHLFFVVFSGRCILTHLPIHSSTLAYVYFFLLNTFIFNFIVFSTLEYPFHFLDINTLAELFNFSYIFSFSCIFLIILIVVVIEPLFGNSNILITRRSLSIFYFFSCILFTGFSLLKYFLFFLMLDSGKKCWNSK